MSMDNGLLGNRKSMKKITGSRRFEKNGNNVMLLCLECRVAFKIVDKQMMYTLLQLFFNLFLSTAYWIALTTIG